jgi:hypothetical protein
MTTDPAADLVENQFFRPLPSKEAEALAEHMYDRWCSHEAVVAEWVNYIPRKWEELEPDIQRGYRAMALDLLSWSNARRDAAVAEAKIAVSGYAIDAANELNKGAEHIISLRAQIARLTGALEEIAAIDFVLHGPGNTHMQAQRIARAALAQEGGRS